jgi:3-phytase
VRIWQIDPAKSKLKAAKGLAGPIKVFNGAEPIGLCTYHSPKTGKSYFFVTLRSGSVEQYELLAAADGTLSARRVAAFGFDDEIKSCLADEENGAVYVAEDDRGIWRCPAEPGDKTPRKLVIRAGENGLLPNVKGPALYGAGNGGGYLLVVSQGSKTGHSLVNIYERGGDYRYLASIDPAAGDLGGIDHCSGLAVCNQPLGKDFPSGMLALNDQVNPNASEDFKLYRWEEIARAAKLTIDTTWSRRGVTTRVK